MHSLTINLKNIPLADPHYAIPCRIDIRLAGNFYGKIIEKGLRRGNPRELIAQYMTLGWILSSYHVCTFPLVECHNLSTVEIGEYLSKFHELEEVLKEKTLSKEAEWTEIIIIIKSFK